MPDLNPTAPELPRPERGGCYVRQEDGSLTPDPAVPPPAEPEAPPPPPQE